MAPSLGGYSTFAFYYDFLGWSDFSAEVFRRLKKILALLSSPIRTVLDLACGTGELALLLAEEGYEVTGVDLSESMLRQAREKSRRGRIRYVRGDIRTVFLGRRFDLVCCFFDSLNHLISKGDLLSAFKTAHRHLNPQARFVFDMITPKGLLVWDKTEVERQRDYLLLTEGRLNPAGDRVKITIEGFVRKREDLYNHFKETIRERAYPQKVVSELLTQAGFRKIVVENFDRGKAIESAERLFYTAA